MNTTPGVLVSPFEVSETDRSLKPKAVVLSNGNLLVAYMIRAIGSDAAIVIRGQQLDANGNKIGREIRFNFPEDIGTLNMDIVSLQSGPEVAILVDQDLFLDRDTPFVGVFRVDGSGDAVFLPGRSEAVQGSGPALKHFDFALANAGGNGWRSHAIGRFGLGNLAQTDSLRGQCC